MAGRSVTGAYLPIRTTAANYGPYPTLDYAYEPGVTAIIGENGAGKSYLVNAPAVALFGHTPDGVAFAELLSNFGGADRMTVAHEFMSNGERYRVRRSFSSRAGGKTTLDLEYNFTGDGEEPWTPHTRESIRATQAWINGLLGFTCDTFLASALQVQRGKRFASRGTTRVERCDLLAAGLGLQYEPFRLLAKADREKAEAEAARLAVRLEQAEQELADKDRVAACLADGASIVQALGIRLERVESDLEILLDEQRQADQRASERRAAQAELREAETARLRLREQAAAADIARDSIAATRETLAGLATQEDLETAAEAYEAERWEYDAREFNRAQLTKAIEALEQQTVCPACHRPFDNHDETTASLRMNRHALRDSPSLPVPSDSEVTRAREQVTERAGLEERIAGWQQAIDAVESPEFTQAALKADIAVSDARKVVSALPDPWDEKAMPKFEIELARQKVDEQRARLDQARAEKARLEAALDRLAAVEQQAASDRAEHDRLRSWLVALSALETMYGRDGIPALVIESVAVPYLEQQATEILHRLGKAWTVEIHLGKETKKGDVRPALDVKAITETGAVQRYEQCSGGEQMRLDIALHVAFVRLWKQRNGSWSELYALDEPEGLDADGMATLVDVLEFLGEEFKFVMLVSHHSELRDSIGQVAEVSRNGRGSIVAVPA